MTTQAPGTPEAAEPTAPSPVPAPSQDGGFDPTQWLGGLTPEQRAAIDEYADFRRKPLETEKHGLLTEVGRLKKATDPAIVARLSNEERLLEQHKTAAASLYGVDPKELEDIDSIDALNAALRWIAKGTPKAQAKPASPEGVAPDEWANFLAWKQGQQAPGADAGRRPPLAPTGGGAMAPVVPNDDTIDALWLAGKVSDQKYREYLNRR